MLKELPCTRKDKFIFFVRSHLPLFGNQVISIQVHTIENFRSGFKLVRRICLLNISEFMHCTALHQIYFSVIPNVWESERKKDCMKYNDTKLKIIIIVYIILAMCVMLQWSKMYIFLRWVSGISRESVLFAFARHSH